MIKNALYSKVKEYDFEKLFKKKGYAYFTNGAYNLNIIGVRAAGRNITNSFDDVLVLIYKSPSGQWQRQIYNITTDPGRYYMLNPTTRKGTAILVPGQYRGAYQIGKHRDKYQALVRENLLKFIEIMIRIKFMIGTLLLLKKVCLVLTFIKQVNLVKELILGVLVARFLLVKLILNVL